MTGTIKTIVQGKPFGFISIEGEAQDLFFHESAVEGVTFAELREGDSVTFEKAKGEGDKSDKEHAEHVMRA